MSSDPRYAGQVGNARSVVTPVIALALAVGLLALLTWFLAPQDVPHRAELEARGVAPEADGPALPTVDSDDGPDREHAAASRPASQPFAFDFWLEGELGAWVRVRIEPEGGVKVSLAPRDRPDFDIMGRVGSVDAGSLECAFEMGGRKHECGIAWDDAMRLVSFYIRAGAGGGGDRVTEHHDVDGRAYVLERRRTRRAGLTVDTEVLLKQVR